MGLREDAIAASEGEDERVADERRRIEKDRTEELKRREKETIHRASLKVHEWMREMDCAEEVTNFTQVDYDYQQRSNGLANLPDKVNAYNEAWGNAVLLSWQIDDDTFVGQYSFSVEKNVGDARGYKEWDLFEVWVLLDDDAFLALSKEELGAAYRGQGIKRRNSWESMGAWSGRFKRGSELLPRKLIQQDR
jgi:hypothetical protein